MFLIRAKGFFLAALPATVYWNTMMTQCRTRIIANTLMKEPMISTMVPA